MSSNPRKLRRIQWWKQHKPEDPRSEKEDDASIEPKKVKESHKPKKLPPKTPTDSKPPDEQEENKTKNRYIIFVGNLPFDVTKEDIVQHFRCAGNVDFRLLTKKDTGSSKGCGFLELDNITSYKKALNLHHSTIGGRKINVEVTCGGGGSGEKRTEKLNEKKKKFRKKRAKKLNKEDDTIITDTGDKEEKKKTSSMKEKSDIMIKNEDSSTDEKMDMKSKKRKQEFTEEELASTKKKALKESSALTAIVNELQLEALVEDKKHEKLDVSLTSEKKEKKKKKKKKLKEEKD